jgi:hypothetical protein
MGLKQNTLPSIDIPPVELLHASKIKTQLAWVWNNYFDDHISVIPIFCSKRHHDIQRNDIQRNDIQRNDIQHNDIQHDRLNCDTQHKEDSA